MSKILYKNKENELVLLNNVNILRNTGDENNRFLEVQLYRPTVDGNCVLYLKGLTNDEINKIIVTFLNQDFINLTEYNTEALFLEDTNFTDDEDFDEEILDGIEEDDVEEEVNVNYDLEEKKNWFFGKK